MKRWPIIVAAGLVVLAWQGPATAQPNRAAPAPAAAEASVTFAAYRDYRLDNIARREARLTQQLEQPGLAATAKARLERQKARYDRLVAMPAAARDRLFRARFERIDANRDGVLDSAERAAWRRARREYYRLLAAARARERTAAAP